MNTPGSAPSRLSVRYVLIYKQLATLKVSLSTRLVTHGSALSVILGRMSLKVRLAHHAAYKPEKPAQN